MRLQQIMSLRQLGFSLKEIRECLENPNFSLLQAIDMHMGEIARANDFVPHAQQAP